MKYKQTAKSKLPEIRRAMELIDYLSSNQGKNFIFFSKALLSITF